MPLDEDFYFLLHSEPDTSDITEIQTEDAYTHTPLFIRQPVPSYLDMMDGTRDGRYTYRSKGDNVTIFSFVLSDDVFTPIERTVLTNPNLGLVPNTNLVEVGVNNNPDTASLLQKALDECDFEKENCIVFLNVMIQDVSSSISRLLTECQQKDILVVSHYVPATFWSDYPLRTVAVAAQIWSLDATLRVEEVQNLLKQSVSSSFGKAKHPKTPSVSFNPQSYRTDQRPLLLDSEFCLDIEVVYYGDLLTQYPSVLINNNLFVLASGKQHNLHKINNRERILNVPTDIQHHFKIVWNKLELILTSEDGEWVMLKHSFDTIFDSLEISFPTQDNTGRQKYFVKPCLKSHTAKLVSKPLDVTVEQKCEHRPEEDCFGECRWIPHLNLKCKPKYFCDFESKHRHVCSKQPHCTFDTRQKICRR
ncbi:MAG: hypothetical protein ACTSUE_22730, partial [Promethearchaeota archaeon]